MEGKLWIKIIYLPLLAQWGAVLGTVLLIGIFLITYFVTPVYSQKNRQFMELEKSLTNVGQQLNEYRQKGPYYLLSQRIIRSEIRRGEAFSAFILSHGSAISSWQEDDYQQNVILLLGWQEFLQFWEKLVQVEQRIRLNQLQLSAQNGLILIKLSYEKK